jgi:hypothetical protein
VTDPRLVLLTSNDPKTIVQLGERGVPCAYIAVEADKLFYKGKRPSRSRSQHVYDKSGKEESAGATAQWRSGTCRFFFAAFVVAQQLTQGTPQQSSLVKRMMSH